MKFKSSRHRRFSNAKPSLKSKQQGVFLVSEMLTDLKVINDAILPVPVAARSKAWVCGRSLAEIVGFETHRGHGCLYVECCQVEVSATS